MGYGLVKTLSSKYFAACLSSILRVEVGFQRVDFLLCLTEFIGMFDRDDLHATVSSGFWKERVLGEK